MYCLLCFGEETPEYFEKRLIWLIIVSVAGGHREPGGDARWPLVTYPGATRRGGGHAYTLHYSVATLPTPVWKFLCLFHLQYTPFHLKFINICLLSVVHSPVNNAPLTTWQLVWKPTKYILNSYQNPKHIWNLKSKARITDHIIIIILLESLPPPPPSLWIEFLKL